MSQTVRTFAEWLHLSGANTRGSQGQLLTCHATIERALGYHHQIADYLWAVPVAWSYRLKSSAGYANPRQGITLHPILQQKDPQDLLETFLHEVAHMMQWGAYRKLDHGVTWWEMMHHLGQRPARLHNIFSRAEGKAVARPIVTSLEDLDL